MIQKSLREECGVVGVSGLEGAAQLAFLGLYALQHRGQEAAGILAVDDDGEYRIHKGVGLVADAIKQEDIADFRGRTAIGHARYSTFGESELRNAQPALVSYRKGKLALSHNGNLTNAAVLRTQLVEEGAIFQSTMDSEVIVHLIARSQLDDPDDQVLEALNQVEGAFSLIILINDTLYVACDPKGFRPLVLGRLGPGIIVASETCALDLLGADYIRDVEPGEVLKICDAKIDALPRLAPTVPAHCIFELVYFARPDTRLWGCSVDAARRAFGRQLAKEHPADADCVFSVPDSSNSAALGYSVETGLPLELALIRNHYVGRTFIQPDQSDRDFRVRVKYNAVREVLEGQRVVMVDDSLVRGTTSRGLVAMLREAGAKEIHFRIASPPIRHPCFYGIDMPTKEELIASRLEVEDIREHLRVDSLGYLSLEGMKDAVKEHGPFCDACFTGSYPTPLTDLERGHVATARR
ncbi:MAG: amidophosphoribosyltransferase [Candidatus Palauibacterales bacterium]|nr:amidophosphoribosyltransferase [Candidatus Palauibacterales bacterium]